MKIILGSGIAGLIFAYYNPDYIVIGEKFGGQMSSHFDLGPRYLHNSCEKVVNFLKELEVPYVEDIVKVGYLDNMGYVKPDNDYRQRYFMKSRKTNDLSGFDPSVMNSNKSEFEILRIDFKLLLQRLHDKIEKRLYSGRVIKINLENNELETKDMHFRYDSLVSSIPQNVFRSLSGIASDLESYDMSYYLAPHDFFDYGLAEYAYVYDCRKDTDFHRMTKCKNGIVLDYFGARESVDIKGFLPKNLVVLKNSQIIPLKEELKIDNVKFIGRYGKWDRKIKTENIIEGNG